MRLITFSLSLMMSPYDFFWWFALKEVIWVFFEEVETMRYLFIVLLINNGKQIVVQYCRCHTMNNIS